MEIKFIETSSGLAAKLVEQSKYDGHWVSSLCHSAMLGLPDNELVSLQERVNLVEQISRVSKKPIIVDVDTFGDISHIPFYSNWFEKAGAHAIIMEDKKYPKQNSLLEENSHQMEDVDVFAKKIELAKANSGKMKVFARLESLIAKKSIADALIRATAYVEAGADGIMIHSKKKVDAGEVMEFASKFRNLYPKTEEQDIQLIAVPTTYDLPVDNPFDIVITANHMTRASMKSMKKVLEAENPKEVEMSSVEDIFNLLGH